MSSTDDIPEDLEHEEEIDREESEEETTNKGKNKLKLRKPKETTKQFLQRLANERKRLGREEETLKDIKTGEQVHMPLIRQYVENYYRYQKDRITSVSRIKNVMDANHIPLQTLVETGADLMMQETVGSELRQQKFIEAEIKKTRIWKEWASGTRGIGAILLGAVIAWTGDATKFKYPTRLWQYAGVGANRWCDHCKGPTFVERHIKNAEGANTKVKMLKPFNTCPACKNATRVVPQKKVPGYINNYDMRFKTHLHNVATSFIRLPAARSFGRRKYDEIKAEERRTHPEKEVINGKTYWNDGHIETRTRKKIECLWLDSFWRKWMEIEGVKPAENYASLVVKHHPVQPDDWLDTKPEAFK